MKRSELLRLIFENNYNTDDNNGGHRADWEILSLDGVDDDDDLKPMETDRYATEAPATDGGTQTAVEEDTFGAGFNIDAGKRRVDGVPDMEFPRPTRRTKLKGTDPQRAAMRRAPDPIKPSRREVEEHMICHIPYASWCKCCVAARALDDGHRVRKDEAKRDFPVVSMDWCFLSQGEDAETHHPL